MSEQGRQGSKKESDSLAPLLMVGVVAIGLWLGYWAWLLNLIPNRAGGVPAEEVRGQFGDMFGGLNALFSALAFAVLIYTMWLQRKELRLQRQELEQTREELARGATAQERSHAALEQQVEAMRSYAQAAAEQVRAMEHLAQATKDQVTHDRQAARAASSQAEAMRDLTVALRMIENDLRGLKFR